MSISVSSDAPLGARKLQKGSVSGLAQRIMDPPRAAKDGFEWVWYPEGYWAERQMERQSRPKEHSVSSSTHHQGQTSPIGKLFSWSTKASRSPQGWAADEAEMEQDRAHWNSTNNTASTSPAPSSAYHQAPANFFPRNNLPQSPYLSESEQVALLQQPSEPTITPMLRSSRGAWPRSSPPGVPFGDLLAPKNRHPAGLAASAATIRVERGSLQLPKVSPGLDKALFISQMTGWKDTANT